MARKLITQISISAALLIGFLSAAHASGNQVQTRQKNEPVLAQQERQADAQAPGIIGWLESLLPRGLSFTGPALLSSKKPQTVATANCYDSGAGISCNGFRNLQEYLSAVHASQNLGIPFDMLKARMQSGRTLHEAIQELRPTANAQIETFKAQQQAQETLRGAS